MTMHPTETALNEFVDGSLSTAERTAIEQHLGDCTECSRVVADLRELKNASAALPPLTPPDRGWERVRAELERSGAVRATTPGRTADLPAESHAAARRRPFALATWLPAAAAVLLAVGIAWFFTARNQQPPAPAHETAAAPSDAQAVAEELRLAEEHYQKAITGLEQIANSEKGSLDPQTAATLQKNLAVVDQAIGESRAALKQQPASEPAQQSLLENFRTKLALLEDTVALINEMRKGNQAGAARIASGLNKKG